jgi:xanthine dehydrogenase large subunit
MEAIIEHIAHELGKDPLEVRMKNFIKDGDAIIAAKGAKFEGDNPLPQMIDELKASCDYDSRKKFIDNFNQAREMQCTLA